MTTSRRYPSTRASTVIFLCTFLAIMSCEESKLGVVDLTSGVPTVQSPTISPTSVNIDSLTPSGGLYMVEVIASVKATDPEGVAELSAVTVELFSPHTGGSVTRQTLLDNGVAPDVTSGDSVFSGIIRFDIIRALAGRYRVQFTALDREGLHSNRIERTLFITRNNSIPILSNLITPDTIARPISGLDSVLFAITASDSDGYADISDVFFKRLLPDPTNAISMFDDGELLSSGDSLAGDGIFSRVVVISSTARLGDQLFLFQARDNFGSVSDSTFRTITITP